MTISSDTFEEALWAHAKRLLRTHESLLRDTVRNRGFYGALSRNVTEGSVVLDIGSGTGVWAIAAAKLGAWRVVAVERDELMVGVIKMLAAEQGVGGRVEAIWGDSFDLQLKKEFDLVISETIGYIGYEENIVAIMHDARRRFLKEGGVMIPESVSLYAAAGKLKALPESIPSGLPFDFSFLQRLNLNAPIVQRSPSDIELMTEPVCLIETDLMKAEEQPDLRNLTARWELENAGEIDCLAVWVESRLTEGVRLSTQDTTSWRPTIYRIQPVDPQFTYVEFGLSIIPPGNVCLTVTSSSETESVSRQYSPELAATEMIASARSGGSIVKRDGRVFPLPAKIHNGRISTRPATDTDEEFLYQLYCEGRHDEVMQFGWSQTEIDSFLRMQFGIRERSYKMQLPEAEQSVVLCDGQRSGSMTIARTEAEIVLADIAVLSNYQNKGIASELIKQLQKNASAMDQSVRLHVDKTNAAALKLYKKLGFSIHAETDLQYEMRWMQPS